MINVTKTFLPPIEDFQAQVQRIWDNQWLTNNGALYKEMTLKVQDYLGVERMIAMTNGTLPIQLALNAYANCGDVITTPFSYVATTASIVWEKCNPVFVDIHPDYLTIDETKIEAAVTKKTTAILATHVFGNPCAIEEIEQIARKYNLKVIYDAAHCFGVKYKGHSIFKFGDISTCSFHATKLFHTGEGGALFCNEQDVYQEMWYRHNFGHDGPENFHGVGINAKMSELQAAMGLSVLPHLDMILKGRKRVCELYDTILDFSKVSKLKLRKNTEWNYSYYPVIFKSETVALEIQKALNKVNVFPRRYFYPSLNTIPYSKGNCMPISENMSSRILCLPLYDELSKSQIELICSVVNSKLIELC